MKVKKNLPRKALKPPAEKSGANVGLRRIIHIAHGFDEAREWEIFQEISMTPGQRQRAARALKERFYGMNAPDVRESHPRQ
jgi:hypothetical protein